MQNLGIIIIASNMITENMTDEKKKSLQIEWSGRVANTEHISGLFQRNCISQFVLQRVPKAELQKRILNIYQDYCEKQKETSGLVTYIYMNCHGSPSSLQIAMNDRNPNVTTSVTYPELKAIFDQIPGKKVLMIQSCHSGASIDGPKKNDEIKRMLEDMNRTSIRSFTRKRRDGHQRSGEFIDPYYYVITSSLPDSTSTYTSAGAQLTQLWSNGAGWDWAEKEAIDRQADFDSKGYVTLGDLCRYTQRKVSNTGKIFDDMCFPENSIFPVFADERIIGDEYYYRLGISVEDREDAGTDAIMHISLQGTDGETGLLRLDHFLSDFDKGTQTQRIIRTRKNIGQLQSFTIRCDGKGKAPNLRIWKIEIEDLNREESRTFKGFWMFSDVKGAHQFFLYDKKSLPQYDVTVTIGKGEDAGTDANIEVQLHGTGGNSIFFLLDSYANDFEAGSGRTYTVSAEGLGTLKQITLRSDNTGPAPAFYVESIAVNDIAAEKQYSVRCKQWFSQSGDLFKTFDLK